MNVAPYAGAWIEIHVGLAPSIKSMYVAPYAGAWIEISSLKLSMIMSLVAPYAGAWIEIVEM